MPANIDPTTLTANVPTGNLPRICSNPLHDLIKISETEKRITEPIAPPNATRKILCNILYELFELMD